MNNKNINLDLTFYKHQKWQQRLHIAIATFKAAIGGFGSGKTWWLIMQAFFLSHYQPKNFGLVIRATYPELDETTKKIFLDNMPRGTFKKIELTKRIYTLHNDSVIVFKSFDCLDKIKNYNLGFFAVDQAEELPESYFNLLMTRFKLNVDVKYEGLLAANPAGKDWVWRRFVKDKDSPNRDKDYDCEISTTEGNRKYLPKGYIERLKKNLPKAWQVRYMESGFDSFEGLVYYNYNSTKCQLNMTDMNFNTEEFKIICGIDPGNDAQTGVLFCAFSLKSFILYIFDEIYEQHMSPKQIKFLIDKKLEKWKIEKVWKYLIDPHSKATEQKGQNSIFKEYRIAGLNVLPAETNVNIGVLRVNTLFGDDSDKTQIKTNLILESFYNEIDSYQWDVSSKEIELGYNKKDKPRGVKDHLMTTLKYICLGIPIHWIDEGMRKRSELATEARKQVESRLLKKGRGKSTYTNY